MRYFDDEYSAAEAAQNTPAVLELIAQRVSWKSKFQFQ